MQVRITVLISVLLFAGCTGIVPPKVDRDVLSKRTFYFLMLMFSFTERSDKAHALSGSLQCPMIILIL